VVVSQSLSIQLLFALFAGTALIQLGHVIRYLLGKEASAGPPPCGLSRGFSVVVIHFWLNLGLEKDGLVVKFL
jgi:hypothetical protein